MTSRHYGIAMYPYPAQLRVSAIEDYIKGLQMIFIKDAGDALSAEGKNFINIEVRYHVSHEGC